MKKINSSPFLPEELVEQILIRLPIKSLLRSITVCKNWKNLITSTRFITRSRDGRPLFLVYNDTRAWLISDHRCEIYSNHNNFHFQKSAGPMIIMPRLAFSMSCNGLFCLVKKDRLVLYNPVIQRYLYLPQSDLSSSLYYSVFGFVYDHVNNDYKVLRSSDRPSKSIEICRLSTGVWEDITAAVPLLPLPLHNNTQANLNGVSHWIGFDDKESKGALKILSFDIHNEVFDTIGLPSHVEYVSICTNLMYLFACDESLFFITKAGLINNSKFEIWKMMEYGVVESWKLLHVDYLDIQTESHVFNENGHLIEFSTRNSGSNYHFWDIQREPLGFNENGQFISFSTRSLGSKYQHGFDVTSHDKDQFRFVWHTTECARPPSCSFFQESLALLDEPFTIKDNEQQVQMWGEAHNS